MFNVLFLCTGNFTRSIMAEVILNRLGSGTTLFINWLVKPFLLGWAQTA